MRRQIPTKMINAAWVLLAAMLFVAQPVFAQSGCHSGAVGLKVEIGQCKIGGVEQFGDTTAALIGVGN